MRFPTFISILFTAAIWISCNDDLSEDEVPQAVMQKFESAYPNVFNDKWEKEDEGYEVEFSLEEQEIRLLYDQQGNLLTRSVELNNTDVPMPITEYINQSYPGFTVDDAELDEENNAAVYKIELKKGSESIELFFDHQGNFLREK